MKKLLTLLLALAMVFSMLTACVTTGGNTEGNIGGNSSGSAGTPNGDDRAEATRDNVNLAIASAFESTDAHGNRTVAELTWRQQVYEPLYYMNELTLEYEPRLATDYAVSDDGLVYTFTLREGVKFHNGEEMKASDVVFSYAHIQNEPTWKTFYSNVDHAEALGDYTVAIYFKEKSAAAMNNVSQTWIMSEKEVTEQGDEFGTKICLAGTGPYYIDSFSETKVSLKAFPDYYRGEASIKTVNYSVVAESATGAMALEAGELDYYAVAVAAFSAFEGMDGFKTEAIPANHITYACINYYANEALENDLVREAIAYAIDKDAINEAAYGGYAFPADYMENPKYNQGAPKGDVVYNYNPEKAKELLKEAGYENGVDIGKICVAANSYFPDVAVVLQSNLEAVGIHAEIDVMENSAQIAALRAQQYALGVSGYTSTGDYDSFRQRVHSANVGGYFVKFEGDKFDYRHFDQLFAMQLSETDPAKRLEITKELNDEVMKTCCLLPLFNKSTLYVWNENLNVVNIPNFPNVYDWSWN